MKPLVFLAFHNPEEIVLLVNVAGDTEPRIRLSPTDVADAMESDELTMLQTATAFLRSMENQEAIPSAEYYQDEDTVVRFVTFLKKHLAEGKEPKE